MGGGGGGNGCEGEGEGDRISYDTCPPNTCFTAIGNYVRKYDFMLRYLFSMAFIEERISAPI